MTPVSAPPRHLLRYAASPLDRVADRRDDRDWIAARLDATDTLFVPVWRGKSLIRDGQAGMLIGPQASRFREAGGATILLGLWDGRAVFAVDASAFDDPIPGADQSTGRFEDLRQCGDIPADQAAILAHARGMVIWRSRTRFCGLCGGACADGGAGTKMVCVACHTSHFPRTDPAVIMLVTHQDRALLANAVRYTDPNLFSTLAGFVEPGESLEEAVVREVLEETGILVDTVTYFASQPWPFPGSLMVGFTAYATTDRIKVDTGEIRSAEWFSREHVLGRLGQDLSLPSSDSIARAIINNWIA